MNTLFIILLFFSKVVYSNLPLNKEKKEALTDFIYHVEMLIELENFLKKAKKENLLWGAMNPKLREYIKKIEKELGGEIPVQIENKKHRFPFSRRFIKKPHDIYRENLWGI